MTISNVGAADGDLDVAIIGLSGRWPGAATIEGFWNNIRTGKETIASFTDAELDAAGVGVHVRSSPAFVRAGGVLEDVDLFDAEFFGMTPREAAITDPQHRLFLECAAEALDHAGYAPGAAVARTGVFGSSSGLNSYLSAVILADPNNAGATDDLLVRLGNIPDTLTTRVSYKLNLTGPSEVIQTACSSSLVAVHRACQSLLAGECDMALAGGVSIVFPQRTGYVFQDSGIESPDGHCRAFDAAAAGAVPGSAVGVVVLRRLGDALADRDNIWAVIRGSAVNNDGGRKAGFTAPSIDGQAAVIADAMSVGRVVPRTIDYVETHGTATPLGDPVEVAALAKAFGRGLAADSCALGSLKTNIGHADVAAGISGLIKTVLALRAGVLPPSLHFVTLNPQIDLTGTPFYVNSTLRPWPRRDGPRRAGVSAFAMGGTNAHVVLEEAPGQRREPTTTSPRLLTMSARTEKALDEGSARIADYLATASAIDLADVAFTLQTGRRACRYRRIAVASSIEEAAQQWRQRDRQSVFDGTCETDDLPVTFVFPGTSEVMPGSTASLYATDAAFRRSLDDCVQILANLLPGDIREALYAPARVQGRSIPETQAITFSTSYALAQLWLSRGIRPVSMIGHSLGEYVAACLAGVFSLRDALWLVVRRAELIASTEEGAMTAVAMSEDDVAQWLGPNLSLAAVNAPSQCVVAGATDAVTQVERACAARGIRYHRLALHRAAHSCKMDPVVNAFAGIVGSVVARSPTARVISGLTGAWLTTDQATDPGYWAAQLRGTVRFAKAVETALANPRCCLLEVGTDEVMTSLAAESLARSRTHAMVSSMTHRVGSSEGVHILETTGRLWLRGASVAWSALYPNQTPHRTYLPAYPFQRQSHWITNSHADRNHSRPEPTPLTLSPRAAPLTKARHARPDLATAMAYPKSDLEHEIAELWQDWLGIKDIGIDDSLFDLGGTSVNAAELGFRLREHFGVPLRLRGLFANPTIRQLARVVRELLDAPSRGAEGPAERNTPALTDLIAEVRLDPEIRCDPLTPVRTYAHVFLTGATGFVGSYLLAELLVRDDTVVHCLVRDASRRDPVDRVVRAMRARGVWRDDMSGRIAVIGGDLEKPRFGLSLTRFAEVAAAVDTVVHSGAKVSHLLRYADLRAANVNGTCEALRLAATGSRKPFHFISSISVFPQLMDETHGPWSESRDIGHGMPLLNGYAESKWVAESIVSLAQERGIPSTIYRLGYLLGDGRTGLCNPSEFLWNLIRGCIRIRQAPEMDASIHIGSVDLGARMVASLIATSGPREDAIHITGQPPTSWSQIFEWVRGCGYTLEMAPLFDWQATLRAMEWVDVADAFGPFASDLLDLGSRSPGLKDSTFDCATLSRLIDDSAVHALAIDGAMFARFLHHLVGIGFIPAAAGFRSDSPSGALIALNLHNSDDRMPSARSSG